MRAIIVEDIPAELESLQKKIKDNCPLVRIVDTCRTGEAAIKAIGSLKPDLVFLDVKLGTMTGLDVLDKLKHLRFEVIFTTGHSEYMLDAIRARALDYLVKPFSIQELKNAVTGIWEKYASLTSQVKKINVKEKQKTIPIELSEVTYLEANDTATFFHLSAPPHQRTIKRNLGHIESKLPFQRFFRIHRSYIVNREHIREYDKSMGGFVVMKSGKKLSIAPKNMEYFSVWFDAH